MFSTTLKNRVNSLLLTELRKEKNILYKSIEKVASIIFVVTILFSTLAAASLVTAIPSTTLGMVPNNLVDPTINPGSNIRINLTISDITDLFTWQIKVIYNPVLLNCTNASYPSDNVFAGKPVIPVVPAIDSVGGSVIFGASLVGSAAGFTGSGRLCQLDFTVLGRGFSNMNYSRPFGEDTFLLDSNLNAIPSMLTDGYFDNRLSVPLPPVAAFDYNPKPVIVSVLTTFDASASTDPDGTIVSYLWKFGDSGTSSGKIVTHAYGSPGTYQVNLTVIDNDGLTDTELKDVTVYESKPAKLYVDPPEIIDPTILPPTIITINVTVNDVLNMYDYAFKLSYDTEMLTCFGAIVNRVQGQTAFTPMILIDDGAGFIRVNVTYHAPAIPITTNTPLALVTVYFQVDAPGASVLHLSETELSDPAHQPMEHQTGDGFIMTLIRDVGISNVVPSTSWAYQGWMVDVDVTANNYGNISESFDVKAYYGSNLIGTIPVVNLASNAAATLTFHWNTSGVAEGNYTISGEATTVPFEFNTTNNFMSDGKVQVFTQIRDVAVMDVTASRTWVFPGQFVNITVTAKNLGDVTESFGLKVYYDTNLLATRSIINLPPGTETIEVFEWNTTDLTPCNNYSISAEATPVPYEFNTTNNLFVDGYVKIRFVGDINGDGKVDMRDVATAAAAFGSHPGTPRWNPDADITGMVYLVPDGTVDMRDVALIAKNFGKSC